MMRFIMPIILLAIAVSVFFVLANPIYNSTNPLSPGIVQLRAQSVSYDDALSNSVLLEQERDKLVAKKNSMSIDNLSKIQKFLPDNVDNIRLILEIEEIAKPYGMTLKDVKYNVATSKTTENTGTTVQGGGVTNEVPKDYGIFDLEFSTTGTYDNFINFSKSIENNLRMVDISSVAFSSNDVTTPGVGASGLGTKTNSPEVYKYDFKIKTYWLKN